MAKNDGVHLNHCYQGENMFNCKYGEDNCPAKPPKETRIEFKVIYCPICGGRDIAEGRTDTKEPINRCNTCNT